VRAEYERQLDAKFAAARGFVDAVIAPEDIRPALTLALRAALNNPGRHLGQFILE
jgi:acetyl-CoA carboxylase carboxyltransferase component